MLADYPPFLSIAETALLLHRSRRSIDRAIAEGRLPAKKLGRRVLIARADIEALIESLPSAGGCSPAVGAAAAVAKPRRTRSE